MCPSPNVPIDDAKSTEEELLALLENQQAQIQKLLEETEANLQKLKARTREIRGK